MLIPSSRILLLAALLLPLAACTSGPQQPSDVVDDQSAAASNSATPPSTANPASNVAKSETSALATGGMSETSASIESLIGGWATNAESCTAPGPSVTLTASRLETMEQSCAISDVIDGGQGSVTMGLSCGASDGGVDAQLVKLSPTATGIDMTVVGGDSGPQSLVRCP